MAKFSASVVERLDYDFTDFEKDGGGGRCSGKGTIPEPSQKDLDEYLATVQALVPNGDVEALAREGDAASTEVMDKLLEAVAGFCKNTPSKEELDELPPRIKMYFVGWISKEFSNPEVSGAATRR